MTEIERDYYPIPSASANALLVTLRALTRDGEERYVYLNGRPLTEVQVRRSQLTDGSIVEDVLLIPGHDFDALPSPDSG